VTVFAIDMNGSAVSRNLLYQISMVLTADAVVICWEGKKRLRIVYCVVLNFFSFSRELES